MSAEAEDRAAKRSSPSSRTPRARACPQQKTNNNDYDIYNRDRSMRALAPSKERERAMRLKNPGGKISERI